MTSTGYSALLNSGVLALRDQPRARERTVLVLGVARSGTSMVAGCLRELGIAMGPARPPVFEDVPLSESAEKGDWSSFSRLVQERNAAAPLWGWKRPALTQYLGKVLPCLRNPELVVVFRDIFAIGNRNRLSVKADMLQNMRDAVQQYGQLVDCISRFDGRCFLVSYEKALLDPAQFIDALAGFLGIDDPAARTAARNFVQRDPEMYIRAARSGRAVGSLDRATVKVVKGWAIVHGSAGACNVEIRTNGELVATVPATQMRKDAKDRGVHPTGECGFSFVPQDGLLKPGDVVSARVAGDYFDLSNSPKKIEPA